jgi:hypothetical protein
MILTGFSFLLLRLAISRRLRHAGSGGPRTRQFSAELPLALRLSRRHPDAFQHPHLALGLVPSSPSSGSPHRRHQTHEEYPPYHHLARDRPWSRWSLANSHPFGLCRQLPRRLLLPLTTGIPIGSIKSDQTKRYVL